MPRVIDSTNEPHDYCSKCFPQMKIATEEFGNIGDGPDGRGNCFEYNADHPDYECEDYVCCECTRRLNGDDNYDYKG